MRKEKIEIIEKYYAFMGEKPAVVLNELSDEILDKTLETVKERIFIIVNNIIDGNTE